jgi:molecular chaperone GrpE
MNSKPDSLNTKEISEDLEFDNTLSIDEFFKTLEAKEKDLDISSDLVIEVDEADSGEQDISDFLQMDLSVAPNKTEAALTDSGENSIQPVDNSKLQSQISNLQDQIAQMETERVELFEIARRRQSDFESYKNRTERERSETFRNQISNLATQMLPVVDNLNRALDSFGQVADESSHDIKQFFEGIVLVSQQLNEILAEMGVQPIHAVGEPFDPHYHEAVATEMTDEFPSQTVTSELLRGYRLGEKIIRPSMVKVSVSTTTGSLPPMVSLAEMNASEAE